MKVRYDKDVDILYVQFLEGDYEISKEMDGMVIDYDSSGKIIGLEILKASEKLDRKTLSEMIFEVPV